MEVCFILVNPARGEHIGFAARALKTMGFSRLRVVNSQAHLLPTARKTAYGSHDILEGISTHNSLPQATEDLDLIIGTTSKKRIKRYDYQHPHALKRMLDQKATSGLNKIGLVFGSEENGLSTEELDQCDLISSIPISGDYPSLNLSQAVLIYAWEFTGLTEPDPEESLPPHQSLQQVMKAQAEELLVRIEMTDKPVLKRRLLDRLMLVSGDDMELIVSLMTKLNRKLKD